MRREKTRAHPPSDLLRALLGAATIVACAGSATPAMAQGAGRFQVPNVPQSLRKVYADEGLGAKDALVRVRELIASNNLGEAARVLQSLLEGDALQVLPASDDPWLYVPVREIVHQQLLTTPALLERYRAEQQATALEHVTKDGIEGAREAERTRLLTPAGLEAALRVAQDDMESARFDAARLVLAQLDNHPDLQGATAASAARLAAQLLAFVDEPRLRELATRWAQRAGGTIAIPPMRPLPTPGVTPMSTLGGSGGNDDVAWERTSVTPLQSIPWSGEKARPRVMPRSLRGRIAEPDANLAGERIPWVFPAADAAGVYVCDGESIAAYDAATLAPLWRAQPTTGLSPGRLRDEASFAGQSSRGYEDIGGVAVDRGVVVGVTGVAVGGERRGDPRVHAIDAKTGRVLWSVEPALLDERLSEGWVRGAPVIDGSIVVVGVRKPGLFRRVTTLYQAGLDLRTGALRWVRQIGSVGTQPWARFQERIDAPLLDAGVVYRGDEMGVLSALDAATGRPLWVRLTTPDLEQDPNMAQPMGEPGVAYAAVAPVKIGSRLFFVEPGGRGEVVALDATTGKRLAMRTKRELGEPRYLVAVRVPGDGGGASEDYLACVGEQRVTFLPADHFANAVPVGSEVLSERGLTGRASALATGELAVCVPGGGEASASRLVRLSPRTGQIVGSTDLERAGNILIAPGLRDAQASGGVLLIADATGLHTHLGWEDAQRRLQARIAQQPSDADPVLTLLELSLRKGQATDAPQLADRVLALVDASAGRPDASRWRERLFDVLRRVLTSSREAMTARTPEGRATSTTRAGVQDDGVPPLPPVKDLAVLTAIEERYGRSAETPAQRVDALLERAFVREVAQQPAASVAALQELLADEALAGVPIDPQSVWRLGAVAGGANAGGVLRDEARSVATQQLRRVLRLAGPAAYEPFADDARRALDRVGTGTAGGGAGDAEALLRIAREYPLAPSAARAAQRAAEVLRASGDRPAARAALSAAARIVLDCGALAMPDAGAIAGPILGALFDDVASDPQAAALAGPLLRTLREAQAAFAAPTIDPNAAGGGFGSIGVVVANSPITLGEAITKAKALLSSAPRSAILGNSFDFGVQVIEGYEPLTSLSPREAGVSHDGLLMVSRDGDRVALFAASLASSATSAGLGHGGGRLERAWEIPCDVTPTLVWMDSERTILLWPRVGGASISCHATQDGTTLWKTTGFGDLPGMPAPLVSSGDPRVDRVATPLDGVVRADDVVVAIGREQVVLAERRGRAAAIRIADGGVAWAAQLPVAAVYDLDMVDDDASTSGLCVVGVAWREELEPGKPAGPDERSTMPNPGSGVPVVARLRGSDGSLLWSLAKDVMGDHARFVRALGDGTLLVGTAQRVLRVRARDGTLVWQAAGAGDVANTIAAWADTSRAGGGNATGLFVMDSDFELWRMGLSDGLTGTTPLDTQNRVTLPFQGYGVDGGLALASSMGVAIFDADGAIAGLDALQSQGRLEPAQLAEGTLVTIESLARDLFTRGGAGGDDRQEPNAARLVMLSTRDARLVAAQPILLLDAPSSVHLLDGMVAVGQGPYTFVYRTK